MNTKYFINMIAGNVFKTQTTPALPSKYYIGLSSTAPSVSGTGVTEPSAANGYARVELASLSAPVDGLVSNAGIIVFADSTGDWGTVTHYVVYDAKTGGNLLFFGELTSPRTIESQTTISFKSGELNIQVSGE